jgi:N-methylhydantoinase B/oxoprolinase/acetone carboxylase alpha subunit
MSAAFDVLTLERAWSRLASIAEQADASVMRTAFSSIIRDSHDYSCAIYDARGFLISQPGFVSAGHLGGMSAAMRILDQHFPFATLVEGDVIITNDPWIMSGHLPDILVTMPVFHQHRLVAFAGCVFHHQDIGGRLGIDNREVFEEGLQIPPSMLYRAGVLNEDLLGVIGANVRVPDLVVNDVRSQVATIRQTASRLQTFLSQMGWSSLEPLADAIFDRTEAALRRSISTIPDGVYTAECAVETGELNKHVMLRLALSVAGDAIVADFEGSDGKVDRGINCVMNYTVAFTLFALKAILAPFLPNNQGAMRPITVRAPQGSILNVERPAAVVGRTSVGQFIPQLVFNALAPVMPERVLAESGSMPLWWLTLAGHHRDGRPFVVGPMFSGALGARSDADGVSCLTFPANIKNTPVELLETDSPLLVERREFITDSGGAGRFRGGLGQEFVLRVPDDETAPQGPIVEFLLGGRLATAAEGVHGGHCGAMASVELNGESITWGTPYLLHPGDRISYRTAGGGGYGPARERERALVQREIDDGLISPASAHSIYGYDPHKV